MSELDEGEMVNISYPPTADNIKYVEWRTKDGQFIKIPDLHDKHLRNIALFLMDMGYTRCVAPKERRIIWLKILSMEWQRRCLSTKLGRVMADVATEETVAEKEVKRLFPAKARE